MKKILLLMVLLGFMINPVKSQEAWKKKLTTIQSDFLEERETLLAEITGNYHGIPVVYFSGNYDGVIRITQINKKEIEEKYKVKLLSGDLLECKMTKNDTTYCIDVYHGVVRFYKKHVSGEQEHDCRTGHEKSQICDLFIDMIANANNKSITQENFAKK